MSQLKALAFLPLVAALVLRRVDASLQTATLDKHNFYRNKAGLTDFTWNPVLASEAQDWADNLRDNENCLGVHSPDGYGSFSQGENLWNIIGDIDMTDEELGTAATDAWFSEIEDYKYPDDPADSYTACSDFATVGHFTAMMWSTTTDLGCGLGSCAGGAVVVCQYNPPGNWGGTPMFALTNYEQLVASGEDVQRCSTRDTLNGSGLLLLVLLLCGYHWAN